MKKTNILFAITLTISVILEIWVRWISPLQFGQDFFGVWPPIDNFMHFLWGLNIFLIFTLYFKWKPLHSVYGVFLWQMLWEAVEMIGDKVQNQPVHMLDHFFYDGIIDTIVDIAGAFAGWYILRLFVGKENESTKPAPFISWFSYYAMLLAPLLIIGSIMYLRTAQSPDIFTTVWLVAALLVAIVVAKLRHK